MPSDSEKADLAEHVERCAKRWRFLISKINLLTKLIIALVLLSLVNTGSNVGDFMLRLPIVVR